MRKEKWSGRLVRPVLLLWLALCLFLVQVNTALASSNLQTGGGSSQPYAGSASTSVTWDNVWYIIVFAVIGLVVAIALGYTVLRLTRDSG